MQRLDNLTWFSWTQKDFERIIKLLEDKNIHYIKDFTNVDVIKFDNEEDEALFIMLVENVND
jgi:hypothetical protein